MDENLESNINFEFQKADEKITYSSCLADSRAANDIKKWTMHRLFPLGCTVAQLGVKLQRH